MDSEWTQNSLGIWSEFGRNLVGILHLDLVKKFFFKTYMLVGMTRNDSE